MRVFEDIFKDSHERSIHEIDLINSAYTGNIGNVSAVINDEIRQKRLKNKLDYDK